jgi:predicted transcriptional regulator of viral defense system
MKYLEFKKAFGEFPLISSSQIHSLAGNSKVSTVQLSGWVKKGLVTKLRRGLYVLNESDRKVQVSKTFLSNSLYSPSYVSTEFALGYYDLIPEKVEDATSITTKKTATFTNSFGAFVYQHVKTSLFFGFTEIEDENGFPVFIAEPEKAMIDFIYLNLRMFKDKGKEVFTLSYRFQNLEILREKRLRHFVRRYEGTGVVDVVTRLRDFMKEQR